METTIQSWFEGLFSAVQKSTVKPMPNKVTKPKKLYTFNTGNIVEFLGQNNKNNLWKMNEWMNLLRSLKSKLL